MTMSVAKLALTFVVIFGSFFLGMGLLGSWDLALGYVEVMGGIMVGGFIITTFIWGPTLIDYLLFDGKETSGPFIYTAIGLCLLLAFCAPGIPFKYQ